MTFTLESRVVERVPAWEECRDCRGSGVWESHATENGEQITCPSCQGEGGRWHEAVIESENELVTVRFIAKSSSAFVPATKSSILVREYWVCGVCSGCGWQVGGDSRNDCDRCLKDADGKPTGAEPDTAGKWRLE